MVILVNPALDDFIHFAVKGRRSARWDGHANKGFSRRCLLLWLCHCWLSALEFFWHETEFRWVFLVAVIDRNSCYLWSICGVRSCGTLSSSIFFLPGSGLDVVNGSPGV